MLDQGPRGEESTRVAGLSQDRCGTDRESPVMEVTSSVNSSSSSTLYHPTLGLDQTLAVDLPVLQQQLDPFQSTPPVGLSPRQDLPRR